MSAFRESVIVIFASLVIDLVVALLLVVLLRWFPALGLSSNPALLDSFQVSGDEFTSILWRFITLLFIATTIGWFAGSAKAHSFAERFNLTLTASSTGSGWWVLFKPDPPKGSVIYVGVELMDGRWLEGPLANWSDDSRDLADRDLTLSAPIKVRIVGEQAMTDLAGISAVVVSAREVRYMAVSFVQDVPSEASAEVASE